MLDGVQVLLHVQACVHARVWAYAYCTCNVRVCTMRTRLHKLVFVFVCV
jgi:hypothetical protein